MKKLVLFSVLSTFFISTVQAQETLQTLSEAFQTSLKQCQPASEEKQIFFILGHTQRGQTRSRKCLISWLHIKKFHVWRPEP